MEQEPNLLLIGDGRLARHLTRYFDQLGLSHAAWSRRMHAEGRRPELKALVHCRTRALLAIRDGAIEPFISAHPELGSAVCVHFSGHLASPLAVGAHPLYSALPGRFTSASSTSASHSSSTRAHRPCVC